MTGLVCRASDNGCLWESISITVDASPATTVVSGLKEGWLSLWWPQRDVQWPITIRETSNQLRVASSMLAAFLKTS